MTASFCPACGTRTPTVEARFCVSCGAALAPQETVPRPGVATQSPYSSGLIVTTRLMAAACMLSAMATVLRFETSTTTGRILIGTSIMVAFTGQLFTLQVSKPQPAPWALALLPMFWIGVAVMVVMWLVALT